MKFTEAPKHAVQAVSAVCWRDGKFLLVKRAKPSYQYWLAFPGGKIERGETPTQAIARELKEETNLTAEKFIHLVTINLINDARSRPSYYLSVYQALNVTGDPKPGDDAAEIFWLSIAQMPKYRIIPSVVEIARLVAAQSAPVAVNEGLQELDGFYN